MVDEKCVAGPPGIQVAGVDHPAPILRAGDLDEDDGKQNRLKSPDPAPAEDGLELPVGWALLRAKLDPARVDPLLEHGGHDEQGVGPEVRYGVHRLEVQRQVADVMGVDPHPQDWPVQPDPQRGRWRRDRTVDSLRRWVLRGDGGATGGGPSTHRQDRGRRPGGAAERRERMRGFEHGRIVCPGDSAMDRCVRRVA